MQREIKNVIEKAFSNYKKTPRERLTVEYVETRLELLESSWQSFHENHKKLYESHSSEEIDESTYVTAEVYDKTEDTYICYKSLLKTVRNKLVSKSEKPQHNPSASTADKQSAVKLPRISIPTFSGKYSEWTTFRDLFISLVHKNESLDNVQRLHYLKGHLSGEAAQLVRHTPVTDANYNECWSLLEKRYDNKKYLSNCILKRLFGLRRLNSESASGLKELLDTTVDCLNALRNLGINVSTWDIIVIHVVTYKLDSETRKQWELFISGDDALPTIDQLKTFIEKRFRALEFVEPRKYTQNNTQVQNTKVLFATKSSKIACEYCSQPHKMCFCKKFAEQSVSHRREFVANNNICFNCLGSNHISYDCKKSATCRVCNKKHHTLLHPSKEQENQDQSTRYKQQTSGTSSQESELPIVACLSTGQIPKPKQVLLATALIKAEAHNGVPLLVRALIDQGSQACFITEAIVQHLRLKKIPANGVISGLSNDKTMRAQHKVLVQVQSRIDPNFRMEIEAYVLSKITAYLPERKIDYIDWVDLDHLQLADPQYNVPNKIDILLGADVYGTIMKEGMKKCPNGSLIAQSTTLGWVLSGAINKGKGNINESAMRVRVMHAQVNENEILKKFWEVEESTFYSAKKMLSEEEEKCERIYENTTKRTEEGRYVVNLPFRDENPLCKNGDSRDISVKRLKGLEKRLDKNSHLQESYHDVVKEYLFLGHMRPISANDDKKSEAVYLPHHAVVREDKSTTRVRVVFNASEPNRLGTSLNDSLMVGPTLQADLRHIVLHWRTYPIALVADIIKMYRQVLVTGSHANMFQRIVWRDNPTDEIKDYELLTVTFGTAAAPYLAVRTLHQVAYDFGAQYPLANERVLNCFYMDDLMTGCSTVQEGYEIFKEMQELLDQGGFKLQKWNSNDKDLLQQITVDTEKEEHTREINEVESETDRKEIEIKLDSTIKVLGLTWSRSEDMFQYAVQLSPMTGPETKRKIVSEIARLFDPLGWVAPSVILAKMFIQKLWLAGVSWDEPISNELINEWNTYRAEFAKFSEIQIPRWLGTRNDDRTVELHGFSDASRSAYAAVVYVRIVDSTNNVKTSLVAAKTRVAPVKQISIPRLELCGAVLLTRLLVETSEVLNVQKNNVHAWTDSTIVLAWLNSHPSRWKTFVGNRVSEIVTTLESSQWSHVSSIQNPADCASRRVLPASLAENDLWFSGPSLLREQEVPYNRPKELRTNEEESIRSHLGEVSNDDLFQKYSSLQKLLRVIAYCRRWLNKATKGTQYLGKVELDEALQCCIRKAQMEGFPEEYKELEQRKPVSCKGSKLRILCPYIDDKGIIRLAGRLKNSGLEEQTKTPIVMPHDSPLTKLLVAEAHNETLHGGLQLMLNFLRSAYWVIGAKSLVKQHIRKCITCVKNSAPTHNQFMGSLPSVRCTPARPFLNSGVDYAGPIKIRTTKGRGHRSYKGYICLFICMSTRAVHLEVVSDMTSQAFIAAFRRFVARRGKCTNLWSDNGTNFVGAAKELKELSSIQPAITEQLEKNGTEWHFIPPRAPNFGGLWEAAVKSTKHHLKRAIGEMTLTYEEMSTLLAQIEACLNSRPMTVVNGEDGNEPLPLTPAHFLVGEPLVNAPDLCYTTSNLSLLSRWQLVQKTLQSFWKRWSNEYLVTLMHRYKWSRQTPEPKIGDIVLIKEDDLPPGQWLLGRVIDKHQGSDRITRVVSLRTKSSILKRPTSKLCILPIDE